jgi:gluconate kinase
MVICGHALIGKSTLAKREAICVDLESSIFCQNDFERYLQMIVALEKQGKVVLTSCHIELRQRLNLANISYTVVIPHESEKERYFELAKQRQPHPLPPEYVISQWENWQKSLSREHVYVLPLNKHLGDVFLRRANGKCILVSDWGKY